MEERRVKIPWSGRRGQRGFAKLLIHVPRRPLNGFEWEGTLVRPNALVRESELWPTPRHPRPPLLLEMAGHAFPPTIPRRRNDNGELYVLWRYDMESGEWREIGRTIAWGWEWSLALGPMAAAEIDKIRGLAPPDLDEARRRIQRALDVEMERLSAADRARLLTVLHDEFACRWCDLAA